MIVYLLFAGKLIIVNRIINEVTSGIELESL